MKLKRAQQVSRATVDKALAVLKAFFNWSIGHGLAANNPVRRVKLFHEDNSRLRYLTREEYDRLLAAAQTLSTRSSVSTPSDAISCSSSPLDLPLSNSESKSPFSQNNFGT